MSKAKTVTSCNRVASWVIEETLNEFVQTGILAKKVVIRSRVPGIKTPPEPKEGEVIVFTNHLLWGFTPPDPNFFP